MTLKAQPSLSLVPQFPHWELEIVKWKQSFLVCGLSADEKQKVLAGNPAMLVKVEPFLPVLLVSKKLLKSHVPPTHRS